MSKPQTAFGVFHNLVTHIIQQRYPSLPLQMCNVDNIWYLLIDLPGGHWQQIRVASPAASGDENPSLTPSMMDLILEQVHLIVQTRGDSTNA